MIAILISWIVMTGNIHAVILPRIDVLFILCVFPEPEILSFSQLSPVHGPVNDQTIITPICLYNLVSLTKPITYIYLGSLHSYTGLSNHIIAHCAVCRWYTMICLTIAVIQNRTQDLNAYRLKTQQINTR